MSYPIDDNVKGAGLKISVTGGETIAEKRLVYLHSDGRWYQADADAAATMPVIGITCTLLRAGWKGEILLQGLIGSNTWTWTIGAPVYATSTPGTLSQTAPTGIRQTMGYAVSSTLLYFDPKFVENVIYWTDINRTKWSDKGGDRSDEVLAGGEWWTVGKALAEVNLDIFIGIFDITGLGVASVISNYAYYATKTGLGTFTANTGASTGMRITTGAVINDSNLISTGDNTGIGLKWNPAQTIWKRCRYRFPNAGDAANSYFLGGLYQDANNYVALRYDTAVDNNFRLITRALGAETPTIIGTLDTNWHTIYMKFTAGEVRFCHDGTVTVHTTNVPVGNFAWYHYLETLANATKNYDLAELLLVQDAV